MKSGADLIKEERQRQFDVEGYSLEHDKNHNTDALAYAAVCYALPSRSREPKEKLDKTGVVPRFWPWARIDWKPGNTYNDSGYWTVSTANERIRELAKAGALIAAEIDRLSSMTLGIRNGD